MSIKKGDYLLMPYAGTDLDNLVRVIGISPAGYDIRCWYQRASTLCASLEACHPVTDERARELLKGVGERCIRL